LENTLQVQDGPGKVRFTDGNGEPDNDPVEIELSELKGSSAVMSPTSGGNSWGGSCDSCN